MAIWNPNNCVVTEKGEEMLSYLQNGVGTATITRVVTGAGRVNTSQLKQQTSVSVIKQTATILNKRTYETGSELEIGLSNTGLTASYTLNQIGVYARHPNVEDNNEILYMLAQCDSPGDVIPLPSVTPLDLKYGFYLVHSNNASITITVNPALSLVPVPATLTSLGNFGEVAIDSNYLYVCIGTNVWKKIALSGN